MVNMLLHRCCAAQIDSSRKIRPLWLCKTVHPPGGCRQFNQYGQFSWWLSGQTQSLVRHHLGRHSRICPCVAGPRQNSNSYGSGIWRLVRLPTHTPRNGILNGIHKQLRDRKGNSAHPEPIKTTYMITCPEIHKCYGQTARIGLF